MQPIARSSNEGWSSPSSPKSRTAFTPDGFCRGREVYLASQGSSAVVEGSTTRDSLLLALTALEYLEWKTRMRILRVEH
jgi:hypothetical protein